VGFLFEGREGDPAAVLKGRVEYASENGRLVRYGYAQGGVTGGIPLGEITDFKESLAKMA
jgi:hypothetical protein